MKERPILFSAPMVRAILEGRKTMTRRVVKESPNSIRKVNVLYKGWTGLEDDHGRPIKIPYVVGDRLWVKETYRRSTPEFADGIVYKADGLLRWFDDTDFNAQEQAQKLPRTCQWRPSIFMPRWASRILLEIANVKIERLQDISEEDAEREGIDSYDFDQSLVLDMANKLNQPIEDSRPWFAALWDGINGKAQSKCWDANPWVWAVTFKRIN